MKNSIEKNIDNLWQSFLNGDDKSFSILYAQYAKNLLEYGYKLCNHHELVDDSLQEIFIDLFIKRNKSIKNLKPYLFISFRNTLIKKLTENRKLRHFEEGVKKVHLQFNSEYSFQENLINEEISIEVKQKLSKAINNLPSKQKEIIYLKFEEGMDYSEISNIMKISVESSRKLLYRALLSLRNKLNPTMFKVLMLIFSKKK